MICQYESCGDFEWLEDALVEASIVQNPPLGCFKCGESGHWMKECPWDGCPCNKGNCAGRRKLLTSKTEESKGRKFLKCISCGSFQWLADALADGLAGNREVRNEPKVTVEMTLNQLCNLSLKR